jgi:hypothetical protein
MILNVFYRKASIMFPYAITSLIVLSVIVIFFICAAAIVYKTPLNPMSFYLTFDSGLRVILSCSLIFILDIPGFKDVDIAHALLLHMLYVFCFCAPFIFQPKPIYAFFCRGVNVFHLGVSGGQIKKSKVVSLLILGFMFFNLIMLAEIGGGGLKWFTSPRDAYIENKFGAGNFYLFWVWSISFFLIYKLYARRPSNIKSLIKMVPTITFCLAMSYFTGSKQNILIILLLLMFYYTFFVKNIRMMKFAFFGSSLLIVFLAIQLIQGTTDSVVGALSYFDYFQKTIEFVSRYNEVGPKLGEAFVSSFWGYVPRFIAPDKPIIYGQLLIQNAFYPGAAEQGYYPAFSSWSFLYLDFAWVGVMMSGLFVGCMSWAAYEYFRNHRDNMFAFSMAAQATITVYMVPLHGELYLIMWFLLQRIIMQPAITKFFVRRRKTIC